MSLMAQVDRARSTLQAANEQLSEARGILGKPKSEAPEEPEEKGLFDKLKDKAKNINWGDVGHTALDVAGLIPVAGAAFDGVHAAWYAAEGDWKNAALSAAGAVPFAGDAATAAKLGSKAVDAANAAKKAEQATEAAKAKNLARFEKKLPKDADSVKVNDIPDGEVLWADVPAKNPELAGSSAKYVKQIDAEGNTVYYTKLTFNAEQRLVHEHQKFPPPS